MRVVPLLLSLLLVESTAFAAPTVGECHALKASSDLGVPTHPGAGDPDLAGRLPGGAVVLVETRDEVSGWYRVAPAEGPAVWVLEKYVGDGAPCATPAPEPAPSTGPATYTVGTWNLEWFHDGKGRGFPESQQGGPKYGPRTSEDYVTLARTLRELDPAVLALQEIHGDGGDPDDEEGTPARSDELDRLVGALGEGWAYVIGGSGDDQRLALLYDGSKVALNAWCEAALTNDQVEGKGTFARQPLVGHFTFVRDGQRANDLAVVAVHLASGQGLAKNHDTAMGRIYTQIDTWRSGGKCIPRGEYDVVVTGDFNANPFDDAKEAFWWKAGWHLMTSPDVAVTPPTRLGGVPLAPFSRIDHLLIIDGTGASRGLWHEEVPVDLATVHVELAEDPDAYRQVLSDHLPVLAPVTVVPDAD